MTQPQLVAAMLEPGFYPRLLESVELGETHTSWVFLAGDHAYLRLRSQRRSQYVRGNDGRQARRQ